MTIYNNASEVLSAINSATSVEEIKSILSDSNSSNIALDSNDLKSLVLSQSVDTGGAKTVVLYAGVLNEGLSGEVYSGAIAKTIADSSNGTVAIIDNTEASKFSSSVEFREAVNKAFGDNDTAAYEFLNGTTNSDGIRTSHGLFGDLSEKFVTENSFTEVRTISVSADTDSILFQKEISSILHNSDTSVTKIDGIEISELKSTLDSKGLTDVIGDLKQSSGSHFTLLETGTDANGNLVIGTEKFFEKSPDVEVSHLPVDATDIKSGATLLGHDLSWLGSKLPSATTLSKLGIAGDILSLTFSASKAEAAVEAGNPALAQDIMGKWAADFLGGAAGATAAIATVTPLIALLAPGAIVAGTLAIVAGIAGGIYGGEAGVYLYQKAQELGVIIQDDLADFKEAAKEQLNSFVADVSTISDFLQSTLESFYDSSLIRRVDPLSLDLDGDGIELVNVNSSTAFFDLDVVANADGTYTSDGVKEQVGWVSSDDGLLTLDKNNNGTVDNILELFGKTDKTGTEELREYDSNNDGVINSSDVVFSQLKIWQDSNQNGISESSELKSLSELGITSINVSPESLTSKNQISAGNLILSEGTYTKSNGTTGTYSNLDLSVNQTNSTNYSYTDGEGNVIGDYNLNLDVLSLPMLRGYGDIKALPIAASENADLLNSLKSLNTLSSSEYKNLNTHVSEVLFQWTGTDSISPTTMRGYFSAQKLATMEAIGGQEFFSPITNSGDVTSWQLASVESAWNNFLNEFKVKLLTQSTFKDIFSTATESPTYDFVTDSINFNNLTKSELYANIESELNSITNTSSTATSESLKSWINTQYTNSDKLSFLNIIKSLLETIGDNQITDLSTSTLASDFSSFLSLTDTISGEDSSDYLSGTIYDSGYNVLETNVTLIGNDGNDSLSGGGGNDTYLFNKGDGKDTINESGQDTDIDTILFGADISKDDVYLSTESAQMYNYIIKFKNSDDQIKISNQTTLTNRIETLMFSDGSTIDLTDPNLQFEYYGNSSNQTIQGSNNDDTIIGGDGDEDITAYEGDDRISGGKGTDVLSGGIGRDTYVFARGDGVKLISDFALPTGVALDRTKLPFSTGGWSWGNTPGNYAEDYSVDTIEFALGVREEDLTFAQNGTDLIIGIKDSPNDLIVIKEQFFYTNQLIENLKFFSQSLDENGDPILDEEGNPILTETVVSLVDKDWSQVTMELSGTDSAEGIEATNRQSEYRIDAGAGNDSINVYGSGNNEIDAGDGDDTVFASLYNDDTITGGVGNDTIDGGYGNDTYIFNLGDGQDVVTDIGGTEKISFGLGITKDDLIVTKTSDDLVITFTNSASDQITVKNFFNGGAVENFEFSILNNDGTISKEVVEAANLVTLYHTGTAGADYISGSEYKDVIDSLGGNDRIYGEGGDDVINSASGDDTVYAGYGNDTINGSLGNDALRGGYGDDVYIFNLGDGQDEILEGSIGFFAENQGNDKIKFGAGITQDDVYFSLSGNSLLIKFKNSPTDQITINNYTSSPSNKIEALEFFDGSVIDISNPANLSFEMDGTNERDTIYGSQYNDTIRGLDGDDKILSNAGDDTIIGGKGNDEIYGDFSGGTAYPNLGNDTYIFNLGDGQDYINEGLSGTSNGVDKIKLGEGFSKNDLYFIRDLSGSLTIKFLNSPDDKIYIGQHFNSLGNKIETIEFADGSNMDIGNISAFDSSWGQNITGTTADDFFFDSGANDQFTGDSGNDTYAFEGDFGRDQIIDDDGRIIINGTELLGDATKNADDSYSLSGYSLTLVGSDLKISDPNNLSNSITIKNFSNQTFGINLVSNSSPGAGLNSLALTEDSSITINLLEGALDADGDVLTAALKSNPQHGTLAQNPDGTYSYRPNPNYFGTDSFEYEISDGNGGVVSQVLTLTINSVNDAPIINYSIGNLGATIGDSFTYRIPGDLVSDIDSNPNIQVRKADGSALPSWLTFNSQTLELTGTPPAGTYGLQEFTLVISDGTTEIESDFSLVIERDLRAKAKANLLTVNATNSVLKSTKGGMDFLLGDERDNVFVFKSDGKWEGGSYSYNAYTGDKVSIKNKNISFDAFDGGEGYDILNLTADKDAIFLDDSDSKNASKSGARLHSIEEINGSDGADVIDLSSDRYTYGDVTLEGGNGNDILWSNDGNDIINGGNGNDNIIGGRGNDQLNGDSGNDIIKGYDGDDKIDGGSGADTIYGGEGNDTFLYENLTDSTTTSSDTILDFIQGEDKIDLSNLNITSFDQLDIRVENNQTIIDDINSEFLIKLNQQIQMNEGDFVFGN